MRLRTGLFVLAAVFASAAFPSLSTASETDGAAAKEIELSQEGQAQVLELRNMLSSRDLDLYELGFIPQGLDDIVIRDRLGHERAYTYLTFRIRNQTHASKLEDNRTPRYAEVLRTIADAYAPEVKTSSDNGGSLVVGDTANADTIILQRQELATRERTVAISVSASDEHGSRIQLLDEPVGSGKQNEFPIDDRGNVVNDTAFDLVRDRVEEIAGRRLRSLAEIREMKIPPYDATKRDAEGVSEGEVFGVAIFSRFDLRGTKFSIEVRGLSNKTRVVVPPHEDGKADNHFAMRILRRTMVLEYQRSGDEFYRETDVYKMHTAGYQWVDTFQRIDRRRVMALTKFYLENIQGADDKCRPEIEEAFWQWYAQRRAEHPDAGDKLPDLEATLKVAAKP